MTKIIMHLKNIVCEAGCNFFCIKLRKIHSKLLKVNDIKPQWNVITKNCGCLLVDLRISIYWI